MEKFTIQLELNIEELIELDNTLREAITIAPTELHKLIIGSIAEQLFIAYSDQGIELPE